jgi:hypothetical protein
VLIIFAGPGVRLGGSVRASNRLELRAQKPRSSAMLAVAITIILVVGLRLSSLGALEGEPQEATAKAGPCRPVCIRFTLGTHAATIVGSRVARLARTRERRSLRVSFVIGPGFPRHSTE